MLRLIASRLAISIPVLLVVAFATFLLFQAAGIDPAAAMLGEGATEEDLNAMRQRLGLNEPLVMQFFSWIVGALGGDLGTSFYQQRSVSMLLVERLPITLAIAAGAVLIAVALGIPLGVVAALDRDSWTDRMVTALSTILFAIPSFWLGLLLVLIFSVHLGWFPVVGYLPFSRSPTGWALSLALPWLAIGLSAVATIARQTRSAMIETMSSGFVRSLRLRGVSDRRIVTGYALKNSMIPVLATILLQIQLAIGAGFIIEVVFAIPGLGRLLLDAVMGGDLPVLQGAVLLVAVLIVLVNLLGDVLYGVLDPKVRPS